MEELAKKIVDLIFAKMEPELHRAMVEKIILTASNRWMFQFSGAEKIKSVDKALTERYKPALDYIADKKARQKVIERAEKNGINEKEILSLFPNAEWIKPFRRAIDENENCPECG